MTMQPCPDCGTLMGWGYDENPPLDNGRYWCDECGRTWTEEEIEEGYAYMLSDHLEEEEFNRCEHDFGLASDGDYCCLKCGAHEPDESEGY